MPTPNSPSNRDRIPVVIAVGQSESRDLTLEPLELAQVAAEQALAAAPGLRRAIERITVVNILSRRRGPAPASDLAALLGLTAPSRETTSIGGNTPQYLVERAATDIVAGRLGATLILGAEAVRSGRLKPAVTAPTVSSPAAATEPDPIIGIDQQDLSDEEHMAGFVVPVQVYPLFESALAHRAGRTPEQQRQFIGRVMSPFTEVAVSHPHAWFREAQTPAQLCTVTPDNRLVAEPYLKRMVAFLGGAQGAAIVVTSLAIAEQFGLADDAVYVWSSATAKDVWSPLQRPDLGRSEGLEAAANGALQAGGVSVDDIDLFDLYSCFPSAVQMAAGVLGLSAVPTPGDKRPLTVTGGLPYFGGPGNNYVTHSIATMVDRLRALSQDRHGQLGPLGLVTSVGWYMTKHSVGVYGTTPPPGGFQAADNGKVQAAIDARAKPYVKAGEPIESEAVVDASTVMYDREGRAVAAPIIATLDDGRRVAASIGDEDPTAIAGRFLVGARVAIDSVAGAPTAPRFKVMDA